VRSVHSILLTPNYTRPSGVLARLEQLPLVSAELLEHNRNILLHPPGDCNAVLPISPGPPLENPLLCCRVRFGLGEYEGIVRVPRRAFQGLLNQSPTPERCLEAYYLYRTRLEMIAERKVRSRQLTDDCNVEISGRDLRGRGFHSSAEMHARAA
jgi:hypothetical protein